MTIFSAMLLCDLGLTIFFVVLFALYLSAGNVPAAVICGLLGCTFGGSVVGASLVQIFGRDR